MDEDDYLLSTPYSPLRLRSTGVSSRYEATGAKRKGSLDTGLACDNHSRSDAHPTDLEEADEFD